MTTPTFWACAQGHDGYGPLPDACPHCPGGRACGAECWPTDAGGRRRRAKAETGS